MATSNSKRVTIGSIELQSGKWFAKPFSSIGSTYINVDTGIKYKNNGGINWGLEASGSGSAITVSLLPPIRNTIQRRPAGRHIAG
jgi:hypothetical protein